MALNDKKFDPDFQPDEKTAAALRGSLKDGFLTCAAAFAAAQKAGLDPAEVGRTADALAIHLSECQLGLFGFPGHDKGWAKTGTAGQAVPPGLEDAMLQAFEASREISCAELWRIAGRFAASRMLTGYLADKLGFKIRACQLGAF